jgi:hypothetical protein
MPSLRFSTLVATALCALGALTSPVDLEKRQGCAATLCPTGTVCVESSSGITRCVRPVDPCSSVRCRDGYYCTVVNGSARCVLIPTLTCANVLCAPDTPNCYMIDGRPVCLAEPPLTCATVLCITGTQCYMVNGRPQCLAQPPPS